MESKGRVHECVSEGGFSRNRYFQGQLLSAKDFQEEQDYHVGKRRLIHRCLFGSRVVCGLEVQVEDDQIVITSGLALDCLGREIYVPNTERITLPNEDGDYFLTIAYCEVEINPVPPMYEPSNHEEEYARIGEGFHLAWMTDNPLAGHNWRDGAWTTCGESHPLVLAYVESKRGKVNINERFAKKVDRGRTGWC